MIERAVISSPGTTFQLPTGWNGRISAASESDITDAASATAAPGAMLMALGPAPAPGLPISIRELERAHIVATLEKTHWRIEGKEGAAILLGIKPSTLRFRMKKMAISRDSVGAHQ